MKALLVTAPTTEPITLAELKMQLRIDSDTMAGNMSMSSCISAGSHIVTTGYTLYGSPVEVIGKQAVVYLQPTNNGTGGTVDCKIQESDDGTTWADWAGGAFTQVTEATDTTIQEIEYTGTRRYIRTAAKILVASCEFGTSVIVNAATTPEDELLTDIIQAARERVEGITRRQLLTATWDYYLQDWPKVDWIKLPFGCLQSVTSVKFTDSSGLEETLIEDTDYVVEINGEGTGRIILPFGQSWPSAIPATSNPIVIRFVCGWTTAADVPSRIKTAIKMVCADLYYNREGQVLGTTVAYSLQENKAVNALLSSARIWDEC